MKRASRQEQSFELTLAHHLRELRWRIVVIILSLGIGGGVTYLFYEQLFATLKQPLNGDLYYMTPGGSFAFIIKICLMGSIALSIPVLVYNLIMFIRPAFAAAVSRKRVYLTSLSSMILALSGAAFGFFVIVPGSLKFFNGFQVAGLESMITADSYLQLVTNIIITFSIMFQLPLLISFIDLIKPLKPKMLFAMEKWVIVGSLVISIMVPFAFDLTVSLLVSAPIIVLYNIAIGIVLMQGLWRRREERKLQKAIVHKHQPESALPHYLPQSSLPSSSRQGSGQVTSNQRPATQRVPRPARSMDFVTARPTTSLQKPVTANRQIVMQPQAKTSRPLMNDIIRVAPA